MPAVSVIVPVHNAAEQLEPCLDMVLNQTLKETEIVCINDGSTDSSRNILAAYAAKDPRVRIIRQPRRGVAAALNAGLEESSGKYVAFCLPGAGFSCDFLEKLYKAACSWRADIAGVGLTAAAAPAEIRKLKSLKQKAAFWGIPYQNDIGCRIYRRLLLVDKGLFFKEDTAFAEMFWTPLIHKTLGTAIAVPGPWYRPAAESVTIPPRLQQTASHDYEMAQLYIRAFVSANGLDARRGRITLRNICFLGVPVLKVLQNTRCAKCYMFHLKLLEYQRRHAVEA